MKQLRLLAFAIAATAWCATTAFACPGSKNSAANAGGKSTTAVAASAKGACPASASCPMNSAQCKANSATAASAKGACTPEMAAQCPMHGTATATAAGAGGCATKGNATASGNCGMRGATHHADCAVCADEMACDDAVKATGARAQVVALRNGAMIVYTLDGTENVRALQAAVARHNERVIAALQGDTKLCSECKRLRGALASGKLVREVVNVERGCQLLITSSDRDIVQQVHAYTGAQLAARTKS
jgi:hypothetical protein